MSQVIWKIDLSQSLVHDLPMGAKALYADYQGENICVWFLCDDRHRPMKRAILVCGTGWQMPEFIRENHYIGSCRNPANRNVWHIFDLGYMADLKPFEQRNAEILWDRGEKGGAYDQSPDQES